MPETGRQRALVRGEVMEAMPPGGLHGLIAVALSTLLQTWARAHRAGVVGVESGFVLARNPDTVRAPDVFFVSAARIPATGVPEGFWDGAPDLAVEIVSPSETADEVREKVRDYLAAGTPLVWVIYPRTREVLAHQAGGAIQALAGDDLLEDPEVLPGFHCRVAELLD